MIILSTRGDEFYKTLLLLRQVRRLLVTKCHRIWLDEHLPTCCCVGRAASSRVLQERVVVPMVPVRYRLHYDTQQDQNVVAVLVAPCAHRGTMSTSSSEDCSTRLGSLRSIWVSTSFDSVAPPSWLWAYWITPTCFAPLTKTGVSRCSICKPALQPIPGTTTRKRKVPSRRVVFAYPTDAVPPNYWLVSH